MTSIVGNIFYWGLVNADKDIVFNTVLCTRWSNNFSGDFMVFDEKPEEKVLSIYERMADCQHHGRTVFLVDFTSDGRTIMCEKCIQEFAEGMNKDDNS